MLISSGAISGTSVTIVSIFESPQVVQKFKLVFSSGYTNWNVDASENDIIEYNGSAWVVSFDASSQSGSTHYMHNTFTSKQYQWTGTQWISSYEGEYTPGYWRLVL